MLMFTLCVLHVLYCSGRGCFTLCLFVRFGRQPDQVLTGIEKLSLCIQYHFFFKFMLLLYTHMLHASLALSIHTALFVH